ncbi:MAG TPA: alpha/beta fold hydrolase [Kofleriaceae bacterium]|nr:alpha/beta fold hydrolase [Kofleriaceae bacterium]
MTRFATAGDGTRLAYEVIGAGPPLLLIAGQASDRHVWDLVRDDFAAAYRVITFDHRGTGESDKPDAPYSTRGFADDAIAVLDAAGAPRAHVYGISMGGRIGQWLAVGHAARLGALVLGCTTPGNAHGVRRPRKVDPVLASGVPARMLPFLVSEAWHRAHPELLALLEAAGGDRTPAFARRLHFLASEAHDVWDQLPAVTTPTLVIHGDADQVNVAANAHLLAERIPGAELHLIPGGLHYYFVEHPPHASDVVLGFLARHSL